MAIELNRTGAAPCARARARRQGRPRRARRLVRGGARPPTRRTRSSSENGWTEYSHWHLGIDKSENGETKGAYSFPFGDFRKVHRSGVISAESRAGQHDHTEIRDALKKLLDLIDEE